MASAVDFRKIPLFLSFSREQLEQIEKNSRKSKLKAGELLFYHGQTANHFHLLIQGKIKLFRLSASGEEKVIEVIFPGQTFAEAVMFMNRTEYPVSASAVEDAEIHSFSSQTFMKILDQSPDVSKKMLGLMSQKLHAMLSEVDKLSLQKSSYRLAAYLITHIQEGEPGTCKVCLSFPKNVLASRLSIKPETLSRIFSDFSKKGLIAVADQTIEILDLEKLKEYIQFEEF
jgi:CRP-like cAMP-binding protein